MPPDALLTRVTLIKILCIGLGCEHPVQPYVYQTSLIYDFLCFKPTETL